MCKKYIKILYTYTFKDIHITFKDIYLNLCFNNFTFVYYINIITQIESYLIILISVNLIKYI